MGDCPLCGQPTLHQYRRLIQDSCGHTKCRLCLLQEEDGCSICKREITQIPQKIQSIDHAPQIKISGNSEYSSFTIILNSSPSHGELLECDEHNETESVTEYNSTNTINSENSNSTENGIETETENQNCNQIVRSPNRFNSYRSPEFNISDYLLFKNPYSQYSSCASPEFKLSDYIVFKSPARFATADQPYNSPIQNSGTMIPNSKSDCLMFSKKSSDYDNTTDECQTICYVLNNYGELVQLSNYIVTEFLDGSSTNKRLMINYIPDNITSHIIQKDNISNSTLILTEDSNIKETCIIQEIDDSLDQSINLIDEENYKKSILKQNRKIVPSKKSVIKKVESETVKEKYKSETINPLKKRKITNDLEKPESKKRRKANRDWSHIEIISTNPKQYKCTVCQKVFKCLQSRVYHSACLLGIVPFKCTFKDCGRTFNIRSNFDYHQKVHSGERPFECDDCKKNFIDKNRLIRHLINVHNQLEIKCNDCGKTFRSKEYLKQHVVIHQGKSFKCKFCTKIFSLDGNRKRHELSHSSERPHKCDVCSASFKSKFLLTRHTRIHGNNKPFSCKHCQQVFLSKSEVQRHITSHFDEKPFSCKKCNLKFRRKDNLKRHIKHHHPEEDSNKLVVVNDSCLKKDKSMANSAIEKLSSPKSKFTPNIISRTNSFFKVKMPPKTPAFGPFDDWDTKITSSNTEVNHKELPIINDKTKENELVDTVSSINRKTEAKFRNENSNDAINFISKHEKSKTEFTKKKNNEMQTCRTGSTKNNLHKHWRRRITESLKSQNT